MKGPVEEPPRGFGTPEIALLGLTSVVWGVAYVFIREGILAGASPLAFAAARYLASFGIFVLIAAARRERLPSLRTLATSAAIGGVFIIGLYGGFLYWGEQYTTGGYAAVLASVAPLFTLAAGYWLLASERFGALGILGIAVGFTGTVVLVLPSLAGSPVGSLEGPLFILAAMLVTSLGSVWLRRMALGRQGLWQIGAQFGVAGVLLAGAGAALPIPESLPLTPDVLGALAALVGASSLVGYFAYFLLHHRVGPVRANVVAYLVPIVGVAVGTLAYGEPVTLWELGGVAIVLFGVTLVIRDSARRTGLDGRLAKIPGSGSHTTDKDEGRH